MAINLLRNTRLEAMWNEQPSYHNQGCQTREFT